MKKNLIILFFLLCPAIGFAEDATDYYILHDTPVLIEYAAKGSTPKDPQSKTTVIQGFKNIYNPNNSIVICRREDRCSAGQNITFPSVSLVPPSLSASNPDYSYLKKFRVFVPPGTTSLNLNIIPVAGKNVRAAARMNYVPECKGCNSPGELTYTEAGSYELRYLDYSEINLQAENEQINIYKAPPYPFAKGINPLSENHAGWVYVDVFSGVQNIKSINYTITVNTMTYKDWYRDYYSGNDAYGLDDQSILPSVAALAGSMVMQSFGMEITEALLKELGIQHMASSGESVTSSIVSGGGTVIPFGCCKVYCCVGIGIMATPLSVFNSYQEFTTSTILDLESLFLSANQTFYNYWGIPIASEFAKNREAFSKLVANQDQAFHDYFVELGVAQQEMKIQEKLGKNAIFKNIHLGSDIAKSVQAQKKAEPKLTAKFFEDVEKYRGKFKNPETLFYHHLENKDEDISGDTLVSSTGTLDPDQIKTAMAINELIVDPYPELQISDANKKTEPGKTYETLRLVKKAQLTLVQYLLSQNISEQSPTITAEVVNKIRGYMGVTEAPLPEGERISSKAFMDLLTDSRNANPNWYAEIPEKNKYGISRDKLITKAFTFQQELHDLHKLQVKTLLMAQTLAIKINELTDRQLTVAFKDATSNNF